LPQRSIAHGSFAGLTDLRRPELLDPARHDRSRSDSGEPSLGEWLHRYAGQNRRRDTAATWVIATPDDRVVAYASLAMTAIDRGAAPRGVAKHAPDYRGSGFLSGQNLASRKPTRDFATSRALSANGT
jgi:hypothetical protein